MMPSPLLAAAEIECERHKQVRSDRFLCLSPLYHTGSMIHWFGSLLSGGSVIIFEPTTPLSIFNIIIKEKISIVWFLVPHMQDILDAIDCGDITFTKDEISSLRLVHSGAQPIPDSLIFRWLNKFPNVLYDTNYGLNESTGPGCIHLGTENINKAGSIGKPDQRWRIKVVNKEGISTENGVVGELILKGPGVMKEYYRDENATKDVLKDGWLYTGDMAYVDKDGFIYLVDRKKDVIISGGENIYPTQVENYFRTLKFIKDVAVVGLPNKRMGEIVAAVIELKEEVFWMKNIYSYCKEIADYQRPMRLYFSPVIRNAMGKIDRKKYKKK